MAADRPMAGRKGVDAAQHTVAGNDGSADTATLRLAVGDVDAHKRTPGDFALI